MFCRIGLQRKVNNKTCLEDYVPYVSQRPPHVPTNRGAVWCFKQTLTTVRPHWHSDWYLLYDFISRMWRRAEKITSWSTLLMGCRFKQQSFLARWSILSIHRSWHGSTLLETLLSSLLRCIMGYLCQHVHWLHTLIFPPRITMHF